MKATIANEIKVPGREKKPWNFRRLVTNEYFLNLISLVAFYLIWDWAAQSEMLGKSLARPVEVFREMVSMVRDPLAGKSLWMHAWTSFARTMVGFVIGAALGVAVGLAMALNRYVNVIVKPIFDLFKPMPPIAWISLAILWFGIGEASKVFIIFIGCFVPALLNAYNGVRLVDEELYDVIRMLGGSRNDEIWNVCIPASFPSIFGGLQIAISNGWMSVVAAELVSARSGLGFITVLGMNLSQPSLIISGMVAIAVCCLLTTVFMDWLEKKLCPWKRSIDGL